jgi:hypothetical protein
MSVGFGPITTLPGPGQLQLPAPSSSDCLQCSNLRQLLLQCGTCGPQPGQCPCGGTPPNCNMCGNQCPCGGNYPNCTNCPGCSCGGHALPCLQNEIINSCGCCAPGPLTLCSCGGHVQPCGPTETLNQCGCCSPSQLGQVCPCGGSQTQFAGAIQNTCGCWIPGPTSQCPCGGSPQSFLGAIQNSCGCWVQGPGGGTGCPSGDTPAVNGICPPNYSPDPTHAGCCQPGQPTPQPLPVCTSPDVASVSGACPQGTSPDPQNPGCCAPQAVEACFVCPKGLPELTAALQGQANTCYLASQMFLPPGSLPAAASP